jgi:hypothetical protein
MIKYLVSMFGLLCLLSSCTNNKTQETHSKYTDLDTFRIWVICLNGYEVAIGQARGFQFIDNQGNGIPCKVEEE